MTETAELAGKLTSEGEKLVDFFSRLAATEWATEVYAEGSVWTIRSILAHLMTSERAFLKLFEAIRQGGAGVSEDFVIDRYNARQQEKTQEMSPQELLREYRDLRAQMVTWVGGLKDDELERKGRHPFLGVTTLREMIKMIYIHNQTHYRDIRRVMRGTAT
ncbi:MAG TPA: DinB family protein [Anaerolineales bacterium]